jgi:hypothetical protein
VDVSKLDRVGGTKAGGFYVLQPDVLLACPLDGYIQTVDGARESLLEQHRIARELGRRQVLVVLVDRVRSQDSGSRSVWSDEVDTKLMCGLALVGKSPLSRAIASFFLGLRRPRVPTRMFGTTDRAIAWAKTVIAEHGGDLGRS